MGSAPAPGHPSVGPPPGTAAGAVPRRVLQSARAALVAATFAACGDSEHPLRRVERGEAEVTGRGMLVIAVDGLRYDRTSLARSDRDTTPSLRRIAEEGAELADAWSPVPERFDAHVSLLTGVDSLVGRRPTLREDGGRPGQAQLPIVVPPDAPSLAIEFLAAGWTSAAFVDHDDLARVRGLDRGFRHFVEAGGRGEAERTGYGIIGVGARFIAWLNSRELDEDWFAYLHMGDLERVFGPARLPVPPHWARPDAPSRRLPVAHQEPAIGGLPRSRVGTASAELADLELQYDAALLAADSYLQRILRHVDEFARRDLVTVVIVGTYGVPFGESGLYLAPGLPDAPDLRVPWVIRPARGLGIAPGTRVEGVASLLDVMPTLLDLAGIPVRPDLHGFSRADELRGRTQVNPRRLHFVRTRVVAGGGMVSDDEHWALLAPALTADAFAEAWTGRRVADSGLRVRALVQRSGPCASDSLRLEHAEVADPARWEELAARFERWNAGAREVRDALQFERGRDSAALAERLRALQAMAP